MRGPSPFATALLLLLSACAMHAYEARPLDADTLERASAARANVPLGDPSGPPGALSLDRAAAWLRERGPRVQEAVAAYRTALARAGVPTPWPNPRLALGPRFGFGPDIQDNAVVPFANLQIVIPVSGRLGATDEVNAALAESARIDALATFRELYLDLRARFLQLDVARRREALRREVLDAARSSLEVAYDLVDAGAATALDVSLFQLELARERSRLARDEFSVAQAASDLSELVAVSPWRLGETGDDAGPTLPEALPDARELRRLTAAQHPALLRLRAEYEVAERRLRLEVARQYPDIAIGPTFAREAGERRTILGLQLGIELPLFDRNQPAIAEAEARREEIRVRYEAQAHRSLTAVERAHAAVRLAGEQHRILRDEVLPAATANVDLAEQSMAAGVGDALRLLDAERSLRQVRVEVLVARLTEQLAWSDLERAVGAPFLGFGGDGERHRSAPPAALAEREDTAGEEAR